MYTEHEKIVHIVPTISPANVHINRYITKNDDKFEKYLVHVQEVFVCNTLMRQGMAS